MCSPDCAVLGVQCSVLYVQCSVYIVKMPFVLLQKTSRAVISGQGQKGVPRVGLHYTELYPPELNRSLSNCMEGHSLKSIDNKHHLLFEV